jgi:hypothetical protein
MSREYPVAPQDWADTPIVLEFNPLTGYNDGEDGANEAIGNPGYKNMKTLAENDEPLVVPAGIMQRSVLDGYDEYGHGYHADTALPGGLKGRVLAVRETTARMLDEAQKLADVHYPGQYDLVLIDGFESGKRQAAGFGRALKGVLAGDGIPDARDVTLTALYEAGVKTEGTYSSVIADRSSDGYELVSHELTSDAAARQEVEEIAAKNGWTVDDVVFKLVTFMANAELHMGRSIKVGLLSECNAHAGGGAADIMPADKNSARLLNLVPYCYMGEEAGMAYMEAPGAYKKFLEAVKTKPALREHLLKLGYDSPDKFTRTDWEIFSRARRVRFHALKALGATFYSAHNPEEGGEDWHYESPGVRLYGADGKLIKETALAGAYPDDSGNPGHTLQKLGPKETAVYGGGSAHRLARKHFGLED